MVEPTPSYAAAPQVKALLFDVFGTVVDWRTSIAREAEAFGRAQGLTGFDGFAIADAWRALYKPTLERVRSGALPWAPLDDLHRMSLDRLLAERAIGGVPEPELDRFNRAWHRLDPWPDSAPGLARLKRSYIVAPCSNGNIALMVNLAKFGGLPWDTILGAEPTRHYKPCRETYLGSAALLRLAPAECMMVAAHNADLAAAAACGLKTAFVPRPTEHGPGQTEDLVPAGPWDLVARDFTDLATRLAC